MNISERIQPILEEIETVLLVHSESPMKYSDTALRSSVFIFSNALMNRMYELQTQEGMTEEDCCKMAQVAGEEIRKLVKTFTGVDTHELWKS